MSLVAALLKGGKCLQCQGGGHDQVVRGSVVWNFISTGGHTIESEWAKPAKRRPPAIKDSSGPYIKLRSNAQQWTMAASLVSNKGPKWTVSDNWMRCQWLENISARSRGCRRKWDGAPRMRRVGQRSKGPMSSVDAKRILSKCWWSLVKGGWQGRGARGDVRVQQSPAHVS